jgi:hypothetical protein
VVRAPSRHVVASLYDAPRFVDSVLFLQHTFMANEIAGDEEVSLADLIHWMNAQASTQKTRPSGKAFIWRHRAARKQLEILGLRFTQKTPRGKLSFRLSALQERAPLIAKAFRPNGAEPLHSTAHDG